jgi:predicted phage-related endonuclease
MKAYDHDITVATPLKGVSREQWLTIRTKGIGGSEVAAILERSKWTSALEIYWGKIGELPNKNIQNRFIESGNHHEPWIRANYQYWDWEVQDSGDTMFINKANKDRRRLVKDPRESYHLKDAPYVRVNIDGIITGCKTYPGVGVLECKTRKSMSMYGLSNGVSEADYLQLQHGMLVLGASYGVLGYLIDGCEWSFVPFMADPDIQNKLLQIYSSFWRKVQKARALKQKHKITNYTGPDRTEDIPAEVEKISEIEGDDEIYAQCWAYHPRKKVIKDMEVEAKTSYAKILRHMDTAQLMQFDNGSTARVSVNKHGTVSLRVNMKNGEN